MSAPATAAEWAEAFDELARWRGGRPVDTFGHALGIDPEPLAEWAAEDAIDTIRTGIVPSVAAGASMAEMVGASLATHTQMGIEMGLWLAQTGRVTA